MNFLFLVLDSTRADHLSCYGYERETSPNIDALCDDGVRYENAFAAAPWTPPSHASIFTGSYLSDHGIAHKNSRLPAGIKTMPSWISEAGYQTFSISPTPVLSDRTWFVEDFDIHYDIWKLPSTWPDSPREAYRLYFKHLPHLIRSGTRHYLQNTDRSELSVPILKSYFDKYARTGQSFLGFTNFLSAHNPYNPPTKFREAFERFDVTGVDSEKLEQLSNNGAYRVVVGDVDVAEDVWTALEDWYDASIAYADQQVGRVVSALKSAGIYDETMLVVTADHGEHFGEHDRVYHHYSLYDELIHVPLVVKYPGNRHGGTTVSKLVSHVDLYPTVKHLCTDGVDRSTAAGRSLLPRADFARDRVFAEYASIGPDVVERVAERPLTPTERQVLEQDLQCVRTADRKYIRVHGGQDLFFDLRRDPAETHNLLLDDTEAAEAHRSMLEDELEASLASEVPDTRESRAVEQRLRDLGYR